ncbi:MAG: tetratricopeptide repeat protein [Sphingobacterium hotanense]
MKWLLVFLAFIGSSLHLHAQDKDKLFATADSLSDLGEYEKSVVLFEQLCKAEPNNATYLSFAGIAYFRMENFEKAKEKFRLAVLYSQDNETHLSNLSAAYSNLGENQKAYEYAVKAMQVKPTSLTVYNAMANANNIHKYEESFRIRKQYIDLTTENKFNLVLGLAHYHGREFEKAASYFESFLNQYSAEDELMKQRENAQSYMFNSYIAQLMNQLVFQKGDAEALEARLKALRDEEYSHELSQRYETRILLLIILAQLLESKEQAFAKELLVSRNPTRISVSMQELDDKLNEINQQLKAVLNEAIKKESPNGEDYRQLLASSKMMDMFFEKLISGNIL